MRKQEIVKFTLAEDQAGALEEIPEVRRLSIMNSRKIRQRKFTPFFWRPLFWSLSIFSLLIVLFLLHQWWKLHAPSTLGAINFSVSREEPLRLPILAQASDSRVTYSVKKGDSFGSIAQQLGFSAEDGRQLDLAFKGIREQEQLSHILRPGEKVYFDISPTGIVGLHARVSGGKELYLGRKEVEGGYLFSGSIRELPLVVRERIATGTMKTTLIAAGLEVGIDYDTIDDMVDLFADRIDFQRDIQVGDTFTVIYRERALRDGRTQGKNEILAALLFVKNQSLVAVRYIGDDGKARYFNQKGEPIGSYFLRYPLKFSRISSTFSDARFHPVLRRWRPHNGVDFAAPTGTPVRAVADATVSFAGQNGGSGNMIKLRHNERYETAYLHLSRIMPEVRKGARVSRGQVIGAVGATGLATGPHLHFSFYDKGKYVDPLKAELPSIDLLGAGQRIDRAYLERVLYTLDHYKRFTPPSSTQ